MKAVLTAALLAASGIASAQQPPPPPPPPPPASKWGAIAPGLLDGRINWGWAIDYPTENEAKEAAESHCRGNQCTDFTGTFPQCGALALGYGQVDRKIARVHIARGATRAAAESAALAACRANGLATDCHVVRGGNGRNASYCSSTAAGAASETRRAHRAASPAAVSFRGMF